MGDAAFRDWIAARLDRRDRGWLGAVAGDPALVRALPTWFVAGGAGQHGEQPTANRRAGGAIARRVPVQAAAGS
jgi:hypothetical protein